MSDRTVYLVHAVDAEGPLAERTLRLHDEPPTPDFGVYPPFPEDPEGFRALIRAHRAQVLGSWEQLLAMLRVATSEAQRMRLPDSFGGPWVFSWFCLDHVEFLENVRRRAMGMHQVFDFYRGMVEEQDFGDAVHWHFHPMSTYREAHRCATSYLNSPHLYEILCRRVLDRRWFPRAHRAGFHDERPDSHWFLEQWVPFDFSNMSTADLAPEDNPDRNDGRFGDWRWAPNDWRTCRPDHDCYMREGQCRRKIARVLNLLNRFGNLDEPELRRAFARAQSGLPTLVTMTSHDFRDLSREMCYVHHLLRRVAPDFPDARFRYSEAVEAFRQVDPPEPAPPLKLDCRLQLNDAGLPARVTVRSLQGRLFGPQPFIALRTRSWRHIHDNMNYHSSLEDYNYQFDAESVRPDDVKAIGIAANDAWGNQDLHVLDVDDIPRTPGAEVAFA